MKSFKERLQNEIIVFDGGTGTYLYDKGIFINRCFEELNIINPELVTEVHRVISTPVPMLLKRIHSVRTDTGLRHMGLNQKCTSLILKARN